MTLKPKYRQPHNILSQISSDFPDIPEFLLDRTVERIHGREKYGSRRRVKDKTDHSKEPLIPNRNRLIVGADDSNHCGETCEEIVVTTFSWFDEDMVPIKFPNRRDYHGALNWLKEGGIYRGYLSNELTTEQARKRGSNLPLVVPGLILEYLERFSPIIDPSEIVVFLDGEITNPEKVLSELEKILSPSRVRLQGFTKKNLYKGSIQKGPFCPPPVYMADVLANYLFQKKLEATAKNPRLIKLD